MLYTFKSKSAGNILMLGPDAAELLRLIGREPSPRGVIEPADLPAAIGALEAAIARAEQPAAEPDPQDDARQGTPEDDARQPVTLHQRAWPLLDMLQRASTDRERVTWGI